MGNNITTHLLILNWVFILLGWIAVFAFPHSLISSFLFICGLICGGINYIILKKNNDT